MDSPEKRRRLFEAIKFSASLALLFATLRFALTEEQKRAVRERDAHTCQYPGCTRKVRESKQVAQVHHVTPQGYAKRLGKLPGYAAMMPDLPHNAVSLCEYHHLGYEKGVREAVNLEGWNPIHPDMIFALHYYNRTLAHLPKELMRTYPECWDHFCAAATQYDLTDRTGKRRDAFKTILRSWRSSRLDNRQIYWNDEFDSYFHILAIKSTLAAQRKGWEYPLRNIPRSGRKNRGQYIWDNIVILKLERYVLQLKPIELDAIYAKMEKSPASRIVFYHEIYAPALKGFDLETGSGHVMQQYLDYLYQSDIEKYNALLSDIKSATRVSMLSILINKIFYPAKKYAQKKQFS